VVRNGQKPARTILTGVGPVELNQPRVDDCRTDGYRAHSMRATFITTALNKGASLEDVKWDVGHADPSTTKLYDRRGHNPEKSASFFADHSLAYRAPSMASRKENARIWKARPSRTRARPDSAILLLRQACSFSSEFDSVLKLRSGTPHYSNDSLKRPTCYTRAAAGFELLTGVT
jgi:hypothetical protein